MQAATGSMAPPEVQSLAVARAARELATEAHKRADVAIEGLRAVYDSFGHIASDMGAIRSILVDILAVVQRLERHPYRERQPSLQDLVAEATGGHQALTRTSTPPFIALAQKGWWKVSVTAVKLLIGAAAALLAQALIHHAMGGP